MAKIDWVRDKLINWSQWLVERCAGASGYPRVTAFARLARDKTSTESRVPIIEIDARETHDAIEQLRFSESKLYVAVWCRYAGNPLVRKRQRFRAVPLSLNEIAQVMCVSDSTVKRYLADAEQRLAVLLTRKTGGRPAAGERQKSFRE